MDCKNCDEKQNEEMVSRWESDKAILHLNYANKRMLIALITVCATFIITIIVFVTGYTAREKNWLDTLSGMRTPAVTEANNGTQQNADH